MKEFGAIRFVPDDCRKQLSELQELLRSNPILEEAKDLLPFFNAREQLSAGFGLLSGLPPDRLAYEYDLFGDFTCDIAVGCFGESYCFVELEDASDTSLFRKTSRYAPDWSPRFEHGFSQIIDWLWKLHEQALTVEFATRFGTKSPQFSGILVCGRDTTLTQREADRLVWRSRHVRVEQHSVHVFTYDSFTKALERQLRLYPIATSD